MPIDSQRKVWMVTGTSTGFGKRLVSQVLSRGDYVIATVRKPEDFKVNVTESDRARLQVLALDLNDPQESIQGKVDGALAKWGRIDVLVNNAGSAPKALLEEGGAAFSDTHLSTNITGTINVTNAVLPNMRDRRSGMVVFLGSRSVWNAEIPLTAHYIISKAAQHVLGETYASELKSFGVRVLIFCPGGFRTENIHTRPLVVHNRIAAYDTFRDEAMVDFNERWRNAPGDPEKAMKVLVDAINGEGKAKGRELPLYLLLGNPTYDAARAYCEKLSQTMASWEDVTKDLDLEE
ncbi:uncharacterized protein FIBRA_03741 [Fibroporia radiculosa]|uniref:NAD-P-binding protein n=1 Tax=Fibroporia radiculosa TaxID=599839 RepID=J4HW56_9APHY|nr:uncharacterized protein FIBRA_03741 [Fibroporia radiculosa]CCM01677.1 predicted protein [Fibroporia radiculosa]